MCKNTADSCFLCFASPCCPELLLLEPPQTPRTPLPLLRWPLCSFSPLTSSECRSAHDYRSGKCPTYLSFFPSSAGTQHLQTGLTKLHQRRACIHPPPRQITHPSTASSPPSCSPSTPLCVPLCLSIWAALTVQRGHAMKATVGELRKLRESDAI